MTFDGPCFPWLCLHSDSKLNSSTRFLHLSCSTLSRKCIMWTNRTNSKTAKSLSAQSSYGLASSLFSTGCTWSAEGALCEKSLTLTGKQSLHGAAVGYQTCVSASLIVPFNTHTLTRIHHVTPLADILRDFKTSQHNYLILLFNGEESAEFACTDYTQLAHKFHKKTNKYNLARSPKLYKERKAIS